MQISSLSRWFSWLLFAWLSLQSPSQLWFRRKWKIWMSHLSDSFPALKTKELPNSIIQYAKGIFDWVICSVACLAEGLGVSSRTRKDSGLLGWACVAIEATNIIDFNGWQLLPVHWWQWNLSKKRRKKDERSSGSTMWGRLRLCLLHCRLVFVSSCRLFCCVLVKILQFAIKIPVLLFGIQFMRSPQLARDRERRRSRERERGG